MAVTDKLYSELTGTITGAQDRIVFFHGLILGRQNVAPDFASLEFTQTQESGSATQSVYSIELTSGPAAPGNGVTITVGNAAYSEDYTFTTAASTGPRVIQRVPTALPTTTGCLTAFCAAFNANTQHNLYADINGGNLRLRSSVAPGVSTLDRNSRDCGSNATTWVGAAWAAPAGGAGNVAGTPGYSVVYSGTDKVIFRVRGMRSDDSLTYRVRAWRLHSIVRPVTTTKATGTDGKVDISASLYLFNAAGANFTTANVDAGDRLYIHDTTPATQGNNGIYTVAEKVSATQLRVTEPFKETITGASDMDWSIGCAVIATTTEAGITQVPFDLPSGDAHTRTAPSDEAEVPAGAIETVEIADGALSADAAGRLKMADGYTIESKLGTDVKDTRARLVMDTVSPPGASWSRGVVFGTGNECMVEPLAAPGMAVRVQLGGDVVSHLGVRTTLAASASIAISAADAVNPRWDIVVATAAATFVVREGVAAGAPADPALTAGDVPLARVYVPATSTAINVGAGTDGWVEDLRSRGAIDDTALSSNRGQISGFSLSGLGASADISAVGPNADIQVRVDGGLITSLTIPDPSAFSIGGAAAVPLNSTTLIVAALNQLATQAGLGCTFGYDTTALRYWCVSRSRGSSSAIQINDGGVNNIADDLLLGTSNFGVELAGANNTEMSFFRALSAPAAIGSITTGMLADGILTADVAGRAKMALGYFDTTAVNDKFGVASIDSPILAIEPVIDNGELSSVAVEFITGAFPQGQTIQIAAGDVWTGAAVSAPAAREFASGVGFAADCAAFIAAVNDAASPSDAVAVAGVGNTAVLVAKTIATTLAGVSSHANAVVQSTSNAPVAAADKYYAEGAYTLDAGAVDTGILAAGDELTLGAFQGTATVPRLKSLRRVTGAGAEAATATLVVTIRTLGGNRYAVCVADGAAVLAASDTLEWTVVY